MELTIKRRFDEKNLPDMKTVFAEAEKKANSMKIGETLFFKEKGVKSESEYKKKMAAKGYIMKQSIIGWNSWDETAAGFAKVYNTLTSQGSHIDRIGVALDWIMGVPDQYKDRFQAGGSLILKNEDEWMQLGQIVPMQPHIGDHMIGSLNSFENVSLALQAGVTTIGNISQYYSYEYPGLDLEEYRTADAMKAIALMGQFRDQGTIIHSNLDDGYGGQFHDMANMIGYAKLERYIVEELLGGRMCHCYGNLHSHPIQRIVFNVAMRHINKYKTPGSMINGNTIDFGFDIPSNYGALSSFVLADIIGQMKYPTGHAVSPIPVTEAMRIPSAQEIIDAHHTVDRMIEKAPLYMDYIDFGKIEREAELLAVSGNIFFERVLNAFDDMHIDIHHAGELMSVIKAIGAEQLEANFGVGKQNAKAPRGRVPVFPASFVRLLDNKKEEVLSHMGDIQGNELAGVNIIVGSTDVHEFGKELCKNVLLSAGANVYDLGTTISIEELADTVIETEAAVVLVSTYNGIALSFAKDMLKRFAKDDLNPTIIMGGRLNETMEGSELPVDVAEEIGELGINVDNDAEKLITFILSQIRKKPLQK